VAAQARYPERPVRIVLPYGAGGIADVTTRIVAQKLGQRMGQNFVIENKPGAGGALAAKAALAFPADGYTLFESGNSSAIAESLFKSPPFSLTNDFTPVAMLAAFDMLLATGPASELDTVGKVVEFAKRNPDKLNFGTVAIGSTQNLAAELFRLTTGIKAVIVTYRTTPDLITAIMRGDVDVGFDYYAAFRPIIPDRKIKVIATSGERPDPNLRDVATVRDSGYPDYVVTSWNALSVRAGAPQDIVARLNEEITAVLTMPDVKTRMAEFGMVPLPATPAQMVERIKTDVAKWRAVIDRAGIPKQ
jgi:tripartite-type tricarboxylate transporter receptor subunit TctC